MKSELSALDLYYLLKEFNELVDGKLDKIYNEENVFLLQIYLKNKGKKLLKVILPGFIFLTEQKQVYKEPSNFCMVLRKYLGNSRLREIKQKNFERILEFAFENKEGTYILILELFSKGNILLCKEDYTIIIAQDYKRWGQRTIRGGIKYEYPKKDNNLLMINKNELAKLVENSNKDSIVKMLAIDLSLGGTYAEELLLLSGIDKQKKKLEKKEIETLYNNIKKIINKKIKATLFKDTDISPFELKKYSDIEKKEFESFSKLLEHYVASSIKSQKTDKKQEQFNREIEKINNIIRQQEQQIEGLHKAAEENLKYGELVYQNYQKIEEILTALKEARKKYSWKEIREKLKGHNMIRDIIEKEGKIVLEL